MYGQTCEQIKRERDDLQQQLNDQRYEADRKSEQEYHERERQRKERQRATSPSNRLYNGEVSDFVEATRLHIAACQQEIALDDDSPEVSETVNTLMRESLNNAAAAAAIYEAVMTNLKPTVINKLREADLNDWADCLDTNDYSSMAI